MRKWNMIINVGRCMNCNNCTIAAHDEHVGNDFPGYAAPASMAAASMLRIQRRVQGSAPMVETTYLPVMCNHCDNAPCMRVGGDAIRKRKDGIVVIDPIRARGRKDIARSCPYGAIVWNESSQLPQTWIFDAHLLDQGREMPRCQQVCPTGVFEAVKISDRDMETRARQENLRGLLPSLGTKPRVWYRNLDRWETCFIGGSLCHQSGGVFDCVEGAKVSLFQDGQLLAVCVSDAFGDFRFDGLPKNSGDYLIEAKHAFGRVSRRCALDDSVYLGALSLSEEPQTAREDPL